MNINIVEIRKCVSSFIEERDKWLNHSKEERLRELDSFIGRKSNYLQVEGPRLVKAALVFKMLGLSVDQFDKDTILNTANDVECFATLQFGIANVSIELTLVSDVIHLAVRTPDKTDLKTPVKGVLRFNKFVKNLLSEDNKSLEFFLSNFKTSPLDWNDVDYGMMSSLFEYVDFYPYIRQEEAYTTQDVEVTAYAKNAIYGRSSKNFNIVSQYYYNPLSTNRIISERSFRRLSKLAGDLKAKIEKVTWGIDAINAYVNIAATKSETKLHEETVTGNVPDPLLQDNLDTNDEHVSDDKLVYGEKHVNDLESLIQYKKELQQELEDVESRLVDPNLELAKQLKQINKSLIVNEIEKAESLRQTASAGLSVDDFRIDDVEEANANLFDYQFDKKIDFNNAELIEKPSSSDENLSHNDRIFSNISADDMKDLDLSEGVKEQLLSQIQKAATFAEDIKQYRQELLNKASVYTGGSVLTYDEVVALGAIETKRGASEALVYKQETGSLSDPGEVSKYFTVGAKLLHRIQIEQRYVIDATMSNNATLSDELTRIIDPILNVMFINTDHKSHEAAKDEFNSKFEDLIYKIDRLIKIWNANYSEFAATFFFFPQTENELKKFLRLTSHITSISYSLSSGASKTFIVRGDNLLTLKDIYAFTRDQKSRNKLQVFNVRKISNNFFFFK